MQETKSLNAQDEFSTFLKDICDWHRSGRTRTETDQFLTWVVGSAAGLLFKRECLAVPEDFDPPTAEDLDVPGTEYLDLIEAEDLES